MFYVAFYPMPGHETVATVELLHSGRTLAATPLELAHSTSPGRVQHLGRLPVSNLPEGTYELHVRLRQGDDEQLRTAFFTIVAS